MPATQRVLSFLMSIQLMDSPMQFYSINLRSGYQKDFPEVFSF
jgi:hypothetical protein